MKQRKAGFLNRKLLALVVLSGAVIHPSLSMAQTASATYAYDAAGRIAAIFFSDGTCVAHTYDSNGNRTGTVITNAGAPGTSVWGSGVWGCFPWQP